MDDAWINVAEAQQILGVKARATVYNLARRGRLTERRERERWGIGWRDRRWFLRADVERLASEHKEGDGDDT